MGEPSTLARRYGPRAMVLGAAEGLGAAFAEALAAAGLDLVLVDRKGAALERRAAELRGGVAVDTRILDLGAPDAAEALGAEDVGLLVCNAAAVPVGPFLDAPAEAHVNAVAVNVRTPLRVVHAVAPRMAARGRGGIVLLGSLAGLTGSPGLATYAGTKAFALAFGRSLAEELRPSGVDVLTVVPGMVATPGLARQAGPDAVRRAMPPRDVAARSLHALGRKPVVSPGHGGLAALLRSLPFRWGTALVGRGSRRVLTRSTETGAGSE